MKKLLALLLFCPMTHASLVSVSADVPSYIHMRVYHKQDITGHHNVTIINNTNIPITYHYEFKVCVQQPIGPSCNKPKAANIVLSPNDQTTFSDITNYELYGSSNFKKQTFAETIITSTENTWKARKEGIVECDG